MNAIFFKNGVYIAISQDVRDGIDEETIEDVVYDYNYKDDVFLFGGRVHVRYKGDSTATIQIDGILVLLLNIRHDSLEAKGELSLECIAAYLNQIENLGVDTFLNNYKENLASIKAEFTKQAENMAQELSAQYDEDKSSTLEKLRKSIRLLSVLLFSLMINLNAGLENHVYQEAYNNIINLYF